MRILRIDCVCKSLDLLTDLNGHLLRHNASSVADRVIAVTQVNESFDEFWIELHARASPQFLDCFVVWPAFSVDTIADHRVVTVRDRKNAGIDQDIVALRQRFVSPLPAVESMVSANGLGQVIAVERTGDDLDTDSIVSAHLLPFIRCKWARFE